MGRCERRKKGTARDQCHQQAHKHMPLWATASQQRDSLGSKEGMESRGRFRDGVGCGWRNCQYEERDTGGREGRTQSESEVSSWPGPGSTSEGPTAALSVTHDLFQCIDPTTLGVRPARDPRPGQKAHHAHLCFIGRRSWRGRDRPGQSQRLKGSCPNTLIHETVNKKKAPHCLQMKSSSSCLSR